MKIAAVIPARFASTRFPGKPLADINGKTMIMRVYEQAKKVSAISGVFIATDDDRIFSHVKSFGGDAVMTSHSHQTGTSRCAEASKMMELKDVDVVINIQGDEPFIKPDQINALIELMKEGAEIGTLVKVIEKEEELFNENIVKVVLSEHSKAMYFSRSPIPFLRGIEKKEWVHRHKFYKHIGLYAYQKNILGDIVKLERSVIELAESLEQLTWLSNGYTISTAETGIETISIDTPHDLLKTINITDD